MPADANRPVDRHTRPARCPVAALASALTLSACGFSIPLSKSHVEEQLPEWVAPIVVGQSDRASVRAALGEPWVSSDYWGFDLFRRSDKNVNAGVAFVFWWPIPLGVYTDTVSAYVLVDYDESGRVGAYDKGSAQSDETSHLWLEAGETSFSVDISDTVPSILVKPGRRDAWIAGRRSRDKVTVLLGCPHLCATHVIVDDGEATRLTRAVRTAPPNGILILSPLSLAPGDHTIGNSSVGLFHPHITSSAELQGAAGDLWYGVIDVSAVQLQRDMPETFRDLPLLIWSDGTWLVAQEPR